MRPSLGLRPSRLRSRDVAERRVFYQVMGTKPEAVMTPSYRGPPSQRLPTERCPRRTRPARGCRPRSSFGPVQPIIRVPVELSFFEVLFGCFSRTLEHPK